LGSYFDKEDEKNLKHVSLTVGKVQANWILKTGGNSKVSILLPLKTSPLIQKSKIFLLLKRLIDKDDSGV
jgi:hypothetical protein